MIRNGLYLAETRFLDGVEAYNRHVMVLRDGTMRGGGGFYYTVGSYTCSDGKWKGEMTSQEHSPIAGTYPWARKVMSIGFTGTYSDEGAEFEATALAASNPFASNRSTGCCSRIEKRAAGTDAGRSWLGHIATRRDRRTE
jgi:hypothetical protein